ncbi:PDR/VanB family oxidoreductase [Paraburkholderia sp. J10-1]|uniref:PDR/VanB family oxidoreductase n=1 Tax=Paraburkholderia sp. J10-1 TaxID=2805430 RepID=UPI002AB74A22|nr:PDR/VanB family oxidoreductase [Paraburkholderia sp. J10-1]
MTNNPDLLELVVSTRVSETADIMSVELSAAGGGPLPSFEAGAHIDVHVGNGLVRQYSLCNSPKERHRYRLGILRAPNSRGGSAGLHAVLEPGARVLVGKPRNAFRLSDDAAFVALIGGGIGITPLMSMAQALHDAGKPFELHYCVRSRRDGAFIGELEAAPFGRAVHLHFDDGGAEQRFAPSALARRRDVHIYMCGPAGFMEWVQTGLKNAGLRPERFHLERFSGDVDACGDEFEVLAARSGKRVTVNATQSIAQALAAAGIPVELSCEQGVCGTCVTRVLEGCPDHRDLYQTDAERATNENIALCCSRSLTPLLSLDI